MRSSNAAADKEYEQAESAYKSMDYRTQRLQLAYDMMIKGPRDEKIAATKADWEQAEADLRKAKWRLDKHGSEGADQRHHPQQENGRKQHGQPVGIFQRTVRQLV